MIIIGLTDIHGKLPDMNRLKPILSDADVVLMVGDITNFGREPEADQVVASVMGHAGKLFAVSGNCDFRDVDDYLDRKKINLHAKGETLEGIGFIGLGGSLVTPFKTPNEYTEAEIDQALKKGLTYVDQAAPLVLVSHQPPFNTACDRISSGAHVGSVSVRKFIEEHHPMVCFTGHIHESAGMDTIGETCVINPGMLGKGFYAYAELRDRKVLAEIRRMA